MSRQKAHHTKQFKLDAINYRKEHPDLTQVECAKNLGIGVSTLARWEAQFRDNGGDIPVIGDEQFNLDRPNAVWCTDITYIWTHAGFVYLNCVMDFYARKINAWTLADTMDVSTVIETINKAKACRNTDRPLIIHSDRGSQYVSNAWRIATEKMRRSYSHSGYPYDNACIESFHSLIKREWLNRFNIINFKHPTDLFLNILKPFITSLGFIVIAIICHLTTLKSCMRGLCLCKQLSWLCHSFYFVLNLDTGPY